MISDDQFSGQLRRRRRLRTVRMRLRGRGGAGGCPEERETHPVALVLAVVKGVAGIDGEELVGAAAGTDEGANGDGYGEHPGSIPRVRR